MHGDCGLENMEKALEKNVFSHVLLLFFYHLLSFCGITSLPQSYIHYGKFLNVFLNFLLT